MGVFFVDEGESMDLWFPAEGMRSNPAGAGRGQAVQAIGRLPSQHAFTHLYVGINTKTMFSINVRIANNVEVLNQYPNAGLPFIGPSCRPTRWCMRHCYAKAGMMFYSNQQRTYFANSVYFHTAPPDRMAKDAKLAIKKMRKHGVNNLRLSGGGDLSPGYVRFINIAASLDKDFVWWGMTKRADLIKKVVARPNVIFQFSIDPTTPLTPEQARLDWKGTDPQADPSFHAKPMTFDKFVPTAKSRGWNFCYATDIRTDQDPTIGLLRGQGVPVMTVFGDHVGDSHFDAGDELQCPCTHPWIVPFYKTMEHRVPLGIRKSGKMGFRVTYPDWPKDLPRGNRGVPSICQTCRWCITAPKDRAKKLPWRTPMGSMQAFGEAAGGRLWIWGKEQGRFLRNPEGDAQFWAEVDHDMANMDPWFFGR